MPMPIYMPSARACVRALRLQTILFLFLRVLFDQIYVYIVSLSVYRMFIVWQEFCRLNKTFTFDSNLIRAWMRSKRWCCYFWPGRMAAHSTTFSIIFHILYTDAYLSYMYIRLGIWMNVNRKPAVIIQWMMGIDPIEPQTRKSLHITTNNNLNSVQFSYL